MATINLRVGNDALTHAELDANFTNLNNDKMEKSGGTFTGSVRFGDLTYFGTDSANEAEVIINCSNVGSPQIGFTESGDMSWAIGGDDNDNSFKIHGVAGTTIPTINNLTNPYFEITTGGTTDVFDLQVHQSTSNYSKIAIKSSTSSNGWIEFNDTATQRGRILYNHGADRMELTAGGTTLHALVSGRLQAGNGYSNTTGNVGRFTCNTGTSGGDCGFQHYSPSYSTNIQVANYYANSTVRDSSKTNQPGINFTNGAVIPAGGSMFYSPATNYVNLGTDSYQWKGGYFRQLYTACTGQTSTMEAFSIRVWANFENVGTHSIYDSGNVSSLTDTGTGTSQLNFSNALPDDDYALAGSASSSDYQMSLVGIDGSSKVKTTTACKIRCRRNGSSSADESDISVMIVR